MSQPKVKIEVRVQNGVVKDIRGIPSDYSVQVLDYDADKYDPNELGENENRKPCRILEWHANGQSRSASDY